MGGHGSAEDLHCAQLAKTSLKTLEKLMDDCKPEDGSASASRMTSLLVATDGPSPAQSPSASRRPSMNPNSKSPTIRAASTLSTRDFQRQMVQEAKDKFTQYDRDNSGHIDQAELTQLLTDMDFNIDDGIYLH